MFRGGLRTVRIQRGSSRDLPRCNAEWLRVRKVHRLLADDDGVITMRHVVQLADGTQNLDVVTFTPLSKELIVSAYVLK